MTLRRGPPALFRESTLTSFLMDLSYRLAEVRISTLVWFDGSIDCIFETLGSALGLYLRKICCWYWKCLSVVLYRKNIRAVCWIYVVKLTRTWWRFRIYCDTANIKMTSCLVERTHCVTKQSTTSDIDFIKYLDFLKLLLPMVKYKYYIKTLHYSVNKK